MLEENGRSITLTTKRTGSVLKSLDWVKTRYATAKREINSVLYKELTFSWQRKIANAIFEHKIQKEIILSFDKTAIGFTALNKSTFTGKGVHSVPIANIDDKRQITATFCVNIIGDFLPVQLIYEGFTDKCNTQHALKIDLNNAELSEFTKIFLSILDKHAPKKQKFIRANNSNFVTKSVRKAIMKRSKLRNKYLSEKTNETKSLYNKQRNI